MPAYNEERRIGKTLEIYSKYFEELRKKKEAEYEILVIINNTSDRTEEIVKKYCEENSRINYLNLKRGGKGYAVIEGFKDSLKRKNDYIGFVDSDMATPPEAFFYLVKMIKNYDGVIAGRYMKGSKIIPPPTIQRRTASRVYNLFIRSLFFFPYRDTQCGAKLFKREPLKDVIRFIGMTKWAFDIDLIYGFRKRGYKIKEVSTTWSNKEYSKINFARAGPWMALAVVRLRILNSPLKRFIIIYDNFIGFVPK